MCMSDCDTGVDMTEQDGSDGAAATGASGCRTGDCSSGIVVVVVADAIAAGASW